LKKPAKGPFGGKKKEGGSESRGGIGDGKSFSPPQKGPIEEKKMWQKTQIVKNSGAKKGPGLKKESRPNQRSGGGTRSRNQ